MLVTTQELYGKSDGVNVSGNDINPIELSQQFCTTNTPYGVVGVMVLVGVLVIVGVIVGVLVIVGVMVLVGVLVIVGVGVGVGGRLK